MCNSLPNIQFIIARTGDRCHRLFFLRLTLGHRKDYPNTVQAFPTTVTPAALAGLHWEMWRHCGRLWCSKPPTEKKNHLFSGSSPSFSAFLAAAAAAFAASSKPIFCSAFAKPSTSAAAILYGVWLGPGKLRVSTSCLYSDRALLMTWPTFPNCLQNFGVTCSRAVSDYTNCSARHNSHQSKAAYWHWKDGVKCHLPWHGVDVASSLTSHGKLRPALQIFRHEGFIKFVYSTRSRSRFYWSYLFKEAKGQNYTCIDRNDARIRIDTTGLI